MLSSAQTFAVILTATVCTFFLRALPFALFAGREIPSPIQYIGKTLPPAVMALLVVYCFKSTTVSSLAGFLPQFLCVAVVAMLHLWKGNTLLSIFGGTICYMFLVQVVFSAS